MVVYEYDVRKNATNIKKHGIDFEEAATVFQDPLLRIVRDETAEEERFRAIGQSTRQRLLLVVFCEKGINKKGEEVIRLISARALTAGERRCLERLR
jgi:uncharacterized DUF497 family protein